MFRVPNLRAIKAWVISRIPTKISDLTDDIRIVTEDRIATTDKAGILKPDGTTLKVDDDGTAYASGAVSNDYRDFIHKPQINGVELEGNRTLEELGVGLASADDAGLVRPDGNTIEVDERGVLKAKSASDYSLLDSKPSINGVELNGDKSTDELGIKENIDNISIQRDIQERLSVPALKRVFRGEIKINSSSSATLYIPLKADVGNTETGDDWIQEGDLFFCDVNPDGENYNCQPTTFSVIGSNEVSNTAGLYTTNCITANANQKDNYRKVPYITYYAISSENAYDNKKGFTILRYRGIDSNKMNFQDLLNGYTNYTDIGYFDSNHSIVGALASAFAVAHAYENDMKEHKFASFGSVGTSGINISLKYGRQYLMVLVAYNASTGAIFGTTARLITTPAVSDSTANVNVLSLGATSNTGYAITAGNYKVTVKSSSASYEVTGFLYEVLDDQKG